MNKCLMCGENMFWECTKGWYCPNGCVIKTTFSNHISTTQGGTIENIKKTNTTTVISIEKEEV